MVQIKLESSEAIAEAIQEARADGTPLEIVGGNTKRGLGHPVRAAKELDLSALQGILLYEPEELVLSARAGTPMESIVGLLAERGQILAFEPPDLGPLFRAPPLSGTLGGTLACNLSGPRRLKSGAARDHFLGVTAISGRGELFKAGGRVMKNVTGYDMMKILAGSHGTLAVLCDITLKVLPAPEKTYTVLLYGSDAAAAVAALSGALGSPHEVSGAAHLPAETAASSSVAWISAPGLSVTAVRVEGHGPSAKHRAGALRESWGRLGETEELHSQNSGAFWREVRDLKAFTQWPDSIIWRLSVAPSKAPDVLATLHQGGLDPRYLLDWGGGLMWLALPANEDGHAPTVRASLPTGGGHATLFRAPAAVRQKVPVFEPQPEALAALSQRLKAAFDPDEILNPGRMMRKA